MKIYIKNMVCVRCKVVVRQQLEKLALLYRTVELGEVEIVGDLSTLQLAEFKMALQKFGLYLLVDKKSVLIEKIKIVITELIRYEEDPLKLNFSNYLCQKLNFNYTYLANLFSQAEGINIEHYLITQKIERVKELLIYDNMSLTDISYKLNYSSVPHLCNQFKKITGLTPTYYKKLKDKTGELVYN